MKLKVIFTLDYEIHGNGDGDPKALMIEPTQRLMKLLERYNAKLTILADVAEILKFKEYYQKTNIDKFSSERIEEQLRHAILKGHDVQLHLHSSYFKANHDGIKWKQSWEEYNMASLSYERINEMVERGKDYLNNLLGPLKTNYNCHVFRAANWSMMPTRNIVRALVANGINIDTSVYKWGVQRGHVNYDYSDAHSNLFPYRAAYDDINIEDKRSDFMEYPIYTEKHGFLYFITPVRLFRILRAKFHKHAKRKNANENRNSLRPDNRKISLGAFFLKHAWKLDFSQASGNQMIAATKRAIEACKKMNQGSSLVLIGHSKTFFSWNEKELSKYLDFSNGSEFLEFSLFPERAK